MQLEIITIYCLCADFLDQYNFQDHKNAQMTTAEVMTTLLTSSSFFNHHFDRARHYLYEDGAIPKMLSKSRLNRRLHQISDLLWKAFYEWVFSQSSEDNETVEYIIDSFPVEICQFIRAPRAEICQDRSYFGYCASKKKTFYGCKAHVITQSNGRPVDFVLTLGSYSDITVLKEMRLSLPVGSKLHADKGYTDYKLEDGLTDCAGIRLIAARKSNSKRPHSEEVSLQTRRVRKRIETTFSQITNSLGRHIHAVTIECFKIKIMLSIVSYAIFN